MVRTHARARARRRSIGVALVLACSAALIGVGQRPATATHLNVTAVKGSAYGYFSRISLFGGPAADRPCTNLSDPSTCGPAPVVTLPSSGSATPITASAPSGDARYGPGIFFTSGPIDVSTQGTTGPGGSVTSSTNIQTINTSGVEVFTASNVASTCTASEAGVSGSTTITNGTLQTSDGDPNVDGDETIVAVPMNPAPNTFYDGVLNSVGDSFRYIFNEQIVNPDGSLTVYAGHQIANGPTAVGDLYFGKVECGVTLATPPPDMSVGDITDSTDPVPPSGSVTYTIPVTNNGPSNATGVTLLSTLSGVRGASVESAAVSGGDGGTCTLLKGKTKGASCDLGAVADGATETVTIVVTAPRKAGTTTLTSTVSSAGDPNGANNSASEDTAVVRPA